MNEKRAYYALILLVLAVGITISIGSQIQGAVTLEPGKDPIASARDTCNPAYRPYSSMNDNTINRYICCEAACREYCAKDALCQSACLPRCTP